MTATDPTATPGTGLALFGLRADGTAATAPIGGTRGGGKTNAVALLVEQARAEGLELRAIDVKGIHGSLAAHARPTEKKLSPLDRFALHTSGTTLAAVLATAVAVAPVIPRAAVGVLALGLIVLSVFGLAACARRRARTRTQGR